MQTAFCSYHERTRVRGRSLTVQSNAFAEREGDFNGAVRVVALAAVQNAREAVDLAEVEVVDAVLAAGER